MFSTLLRKRLPFYCQTLTQPFYHMFWKVGNA
jgi:hypothetical protein